jgi:hypothetical protein
MTRSMRPRIYIRTAVRILTVIALVVTAGLLIAYIGSHTWAVIALIVVLWAAVILAGSRALFPRRR